jgi:predicted nucleic acid-binding protein
MTVVADSTPCIYLARLGDLGILRQLFGKIVLPEAVWREPPMRLFRAPRNFWLRGIVGLP